MTINDKMTKWILNNRHYSHRDIALILHTEKNKSKLNAFAQTLLELYYHDNPYNAGIIDDMKTTLTEFYKKVS